MSRQCCVAGRARHTLARSLSKATASIVPAAMLVLLPKCPVCAAAWLTFATGISFPAASAARLCGSMALLWLAALAVIIWRHWEHRPAFLRRLL